MMEQIPTVGRQTEQRVKLSALCVLTNQRLHAESCHGVTAGGQLPLSCDGAAEQEQDWSAGFRLC